MITNFFDNQKNKKIDYNKNNINKLKDETKIQKQKQIKLGESLEQEIHITAEKKREQYIKYLIDKIKTLEVELKQSNEKINNCDKEKQKSLQLCNDIIDNLKTKLNYLDTEKNTYKQNLEKSEKQLHQVVIEKDTYKQNLEKSEKQLHQVVIEKNTYKQNLDKSEKQLHQVVIEKDTYKQNLEKSEKQLQQLVTEKNNYKQNFEKSEKQLQQVNMENNTYKQNLDKSEKQLQQVVKENNTYKESLLKNENTIIYNNPIINIPTIHIIYQYKYKNNVSVTGLGDFIRCCFYILQFSDSYNINIDFNVYKHPIKTYLKYFLNKEAISESISNNISFFEKKNYKYFTKNNIIDYYYYNIDNDLFKFIKQIETYDKHKYLYLVNHPDETRILEQHRTKIRELFEPVYELQMKIENILTSLNLIKHKYKIIHVRLNDNSFNGNYINFTDKQTINIINTINAIKKTTTDDIFLLCSNNVFKKHIIQQTPNIKTIFSEISHIGESTITTDDSLINTLIDFYIMSYSNHIYSFSVYEHGSGFSKWCAVMYNIPYICIKL